MSFTELFQQIVTLTQTIADDAQLSPAERAALALAGYERFDRLIKEPTIHYELTKED